MALNHSKSVTAHKNCIKPWRYSMIKRTVKYVSKLTFNKAMSYKRIRQKTNEIQKLSKVSSKVSQRQKRW